MKVLELFSGTHSVGKVCKELGYEVISVDLEKHKGCAPPTFQINIMELDFKSYDVGSFDIIWASPPCCKYSNIKQSNYGRLTKEGITYTREMHEVEMKESDIILQRTLDIIEYLKPRLWFIENPGLSKMRYRLNMNTLPNYVVSYCKYADWGYQKNTRIWTNKIGFKPLKCKRDCTSMDKPGKLHRVCIGGLVGQKSRSTTTKLQRYRIPPNLIRDLLL